MLTAIQQCLNLRLTDIQEFMMKLLIILALVLLMAGAVFSQDLKRTQSIDQSPKCQFFVNYHRETF